MNTDGVKRGLQDKGPPEAKGGKDGPSYPCHSGVHLPSSFSVLLAPPPSFLCPGHDLPGSLSSSPRAWLLGQAGLSHIQAALMGAPCPGSQMRVEEGLLGDSGKAAAFQVGEQRPREGTGLTQGHTAGIPMPLPPQIFPLCH